MTHDISPERWHRTKELFATALTLSGPERDRFLETQCAHDDLMLREVRQLLAAHEQRGPLDELHEQVQATLRTPPDIQSLHGRRIGKYEIVEQIGEGGMGRVFLARRCDGAYDRYVALKLLRTDLADQAQSERFLAERQILARLNHPNIARLLDGGVTSDGCPFFAMDYVEGKPLHEFCDDRSLSIEQRVRLFLSICDVVQYAHRALIVHRDLKPSNILITESGDVKLLDFGVAKLLRPAPDAETPVRTVTGLLPLTPAYASPEQIRGGTITTATDVYQLGAVLYELLAGHPPFDLKGCTAGQIEQIICNEIPRLPSATVAHRPEGVAKPNCGLDALQLRKRLRGDLDTIVMKALRKEQELRYPGVEQLADDLRRYLEGRPIAARSQTWLYRGTRFALRHRWGVAMAAFAILLIAGYATSVTRHSQQTQAALAEAELSARRSEHVTSFMMDLFAASDPTEASGDTITARQLLDRGVERAERLGDQPVVQADMFDVMGRAHANLGNYSSAVSILEDALEIRRAVHGDEHLKTAATRASLASAMRLSGRYRESIPIFREALATQRRLQGRDHPDVAATLSQLGGVLRVDGDLEGAEAVLREAMAIQRSIGPDAAEDLSETLNILGLLLTDRKEWNEAEAVLRESLAIRQRVLRDPHPRVAMTLNNLAMLLRKKGSPEDAAPVYREALALKQRLYGEEHPSVAASINGLGLALKDMGRLDDAEAQSRRALAIRRAALGEGHPLVAGSLNNIGNVLAAKGDLDGAASRFDSSLTMMTAAVGETHPWVAIPALGLGRVRMQQGRPEQAEVLLRRALDLRTAAMPEGDPEVAEAASLLGACLTRLGRFQEAESLLVRTSGQLAGREEASELARETTRRLVELYEHWEKPDDAASYAALLAVDGDASTR